MPKNYVKANEHGTYIDSQTIETALQCSPRIQVTKIIPRWFCGDFKLGVIGKNAIRDTTIEAMWNHDGD